MRLTSRAAVAGLATAVISSNIVGQQTLPRAPGARVVTASPVGREEPSIAVNPRSPNQVIVAYQLGAETAYSVDSGRTFTPSTGVIDSNWQQTGDVSLAFDNVGRAFLSYVGGDKEGSAYYWGHGAGRSGIIVRRSLDGGKSWEPNGVVVRSPPVSANTPSQDMNRIFADNNPASPYAGNLYMGWIEWQLKRSIMIFSRSTDGGQSWSPAIRISTHAGLPRDGNGDVVGFHGTVGPDGVIYTVWHDGNSIVFTTSHDGGKTFAPSRAIIETGPPYMGAIPGLGVVFGAMGFPQVGVDPRGTALYITWSDYRNGDIDVFFARSADGGHSWSPAQRVNDTPIHDGTDQYFQWMAVDAVTGSIYVQFYDRRDDPTDRLSSVTLARSTDGGRTFTNYQWSDSAFDGHDVRLGDYMWLVAYDNRVYGAWAEPALAEPSTAPAPAQTPGILQASPNAAASRYAPVIHVGTADFSRR
jgi:hypothetical protein